MITCTANIISYYMYRCHEIWHSSSLIPGLPVFFIILPLNSTNTTKLMKATMENGCNKTLFSVQSKIPHIVTWSYICISRVHVTRPEKKSLGTRLAQFRVSNNLLHENTHICLYSQPVPANVLRPLSLAVYHVPVGNEPYTIL